MARYYAIEMYLSGTNRGERAVVFLIRIYLKIENRRSDATQHSPIHLPNISRFQDALRCPHNYCAVCVQKSVDWKE